MAEKKNVPPMADADPLQTYRQKRDFRHTNEPANGGEPSRAAGIFVIQKHWASRLHYDFRLELDGTLKSWAVPKGPSLDPTEKRMAVQVEDHPLAYASFEGEIPAGQYGAGRVIVWDQGTWTPLGDAHQGFKEGHLKFLLDGERLRGKWVLIRIRGKENAHGKPPKQPPWLLIKEKDDAKARVKDNGPDAETPVPPDAIRRLKSAPAEREANIKPAHRQSAPRREKSVGAASFALPAGAIPAALPATLRPQLATLVDRAPGHAEDWMYEIKYDGYRLLTRVDEGSLTVFTRAGNDWSAKLPALVAALSAARLPAGWYDGEIVVLGKNGVPDFQALQGAFDSGRTQPIIYVLFDIPYCAGHDLRQVPLSERRALLQTLLANVADDGAESPLLRLSDTLDVNLAGAAAASAAPDLLAAACRLGLEGVIGKRRQSTYSSRRSNDWIKLKCGRRQEFVIGGYTDPQGSRSGIGALLLGVQAENTQPEGAQSGLRYAGKVGSGFDERTLAMLAKKLAAIERPENPFIDGGGAHASELRNAHWVQPTLLAEVSFANWTASGRLRHAVFHGLRSDKPARGIVRERAQASPEPPTSSLPSSLRITHPERVIDRRSGATKLDLLHYYAAVAPLMLPHLLARPVSLLRAPAGINGPTFFQKHLDTANDTGKAARQLGVVELPAQFDPGHAPLMTITHADGLLAGVQMNVVELHTWNALRTAIDCPDRMTFDLDPGEGVDWAQMQEAARLVKDMLDHLGLPAYLKTSGGKGLHVVVPIASKFGWDAVKDFSQAVVRHLANALPMRFVAKSGPRNRVGKIFIDYLRNGFGATTVCAWSARARPGLGVSVPVDWDELDSLHDGSHWTVHTIGPRLALGNAPWAGYPKLTSTGGDGATPAGSAVPTLITPGDLREAMRRLNFDPCPTLPVSSTTATGQR